MRECGYLIDAKIGDDVIRKRTYRKECGHAVDKGWYDYDSNELSGSELERVKAESGSLESFNPAFSDDHGRFFSGVSYVNSASNLPTDYRNIIVSLSGESSEESLSFHSLSSFQGDEYYIIIRNLSSVNKKILNGTGIGMWGGNIEVSAGGTASVFVNCVDGNWFFDLRSRGTSNYITNFVIQDGLYIYSGVWTSTGVWQYEPSN